MNIPLKADATGRSTSKPARKKDRSFDSPPPGVFVWFTPEMLSSPAWRAMSLAARKALDRIILEHLAHGRRENGRLPVTYTDFQSAGVDRSSIPQAIADLEALGWAVQMQRGRRRFGDAPARASRFRLTFLGVLMDEDRLAPTDDWRGIETDEQAQSALRAARAARAKVPDEELRREPAPVKAGFA